MPLLRRRRGPAPQQWMILAQEEPTSSTRRAARSLRSAWPSHGTPALAWSSEKSDWRRRKSMLSSRCRAPAAAGRNNSSMVRCGDDQRADRLGAVLALDVRKRLRDVVERRLPSRLRCHAPSCLIIGAIRRSAELTLVGKAVAVRQPALVDRLVLQRQHPHHAVLLDLHEMLDPSESCGRPIVGASAPRCAPVAERLAGQRADRAEVDHVARQLGLDRAAHESSRSRNARPGRPCRVP